MSQVQSQSVITIDPPLPCGLVKSTGMCGKPAHKGRVHQSSDMVGKWVVTPVCRDCSAAALSLLWGGGRPEASQPPSPAPSPPPVSRPEKPVKLRKRYVAQFMNHDTNSFKDFAYWSTEKQAIGYVLMTIGSNPQVKAGRVFDRLEQCVVGEVHYRA